MNNLLLKQNPKKILQAKQLLKTEKIRRARESMIHFTTYTMPHYEVNWHHRNLGLALDKMARKEIKRLMVFMPPRYGKSELVSRRFPAYILGQNPDASIIATSYSSSLASSMNRDVQRIIDSDLYRDVFPHTKLQSPQNREGNYLRNSSMFEVIGHQGVYLSAGVNGGITGRGADFAIIDDPIKNRKDAESKVYRDSTYDWFTSTLYTRLEKDACILITLTRWHEDDLAGRLLQHAKEDETGEQWEIINYPAIYDDGLPNIDTTDPRENGEPLWPSKFDLNRLKTMKTSLGSYEWNALYQQTPSPASSGIFQRHWFQFYDERPNLNDFDEIIQSWDMTFKDTKTSDYVVGQVWGKIGANKYLIDQVRGRFDFTQTIRAVKNLSTKYPMAKAKLIEDKANGPAVISTLKYQISGLIPVEPFGSKESRAYAVSPQFEAGNVFLPSRRIAPWVDDYIEELVAFPNGTHDDQVDSTTQSLQRLEHHKPKPKIKARAF